MSRGYHKFVGRKVESPGCACTRTAPCAKHMNLARGSQRSNRTDRPTPRLLIQQQFPLAASRVGTRLPFL